MPLAFNSLSHGAVAFGFFNIDSDMLLLEQEFFFAGDFCEAIVELASSNDADGVEWSGYHIAHRADVGDLLGAIHGVRHTGFIGETYKRFPFPSLPEDFKQQPEGAANREVFTRMIEPFGEVRALGIRCDREQSEATIGGYRFEREEFHRLIDYVWFGGHPRWRGGVRPDYVTRMVEVVRESSHWIFNGIVLSE
jgi:hypothetical protein